MTRNDTIRANSAAAISGPSAGLGRPWEYARRISKLGIEPRVFGEWSTVTALDTLGRGTETFDEQRNIFKLADIVNLRISEFDISPLVRLGDIFRASDGSVWAITSVNPYRVGTVQFTIERDTALSATPNKTGGV